MPAVPHRHFGSVRKLPSGRWQARYEHDGTYRSAPTTFKTKADAQAWLSEAETDLRRGSWVDPKAGHVTFARYAESWLEHRPDLRASTRAKYRRLLDQHLLPAFGHAAMAAVQPSVVRGWWGKLSASAPVTAAGAYRLLATICNTAVADQVITRSPCIIKGAGRERSPERPTASVAEVTAAIEAVPEHYRLALLLAAWCQLRRGEILGLQRRDIDELHGELRVERAFVVHSDGTHAVGAPKTDAGRRTVAIPENVMPLLSAHLADNVKAKPDAWIFAGEDGKPVMPRTLSRVWG